METGFYIIVVKMKSCFKTGFVGMAFAEISSIVNVLFSLDFVSFIRTKQKFTVNVENF